MAKFNDELEEFYDLTSQIAPDAALLASTPARDLLTRRLADIVCLPASRVSPQERAMTADVLLHLLRESDGMLKRKVAQRVANQAEAPQPLLRRLALDSFEIAQPILERSTALGEFDMMEVVKRASTRHRIALAQRNPVSETLSATIVHVSDRSVIEALLANPHARLAGPTVESLIGLAGDLPSVAGLLVKRSELRPGQAFRLFWDCRTEERRMILDRFAVGRAILQEAAEDVFPMLQSGVAPDAATMKALSYIERRQRERDPRAAGHYGELEDVVAAASRRGFTPQLIEEAARLARIHTPLMRRILDDPGGEAAAVLAKATGLGRDRVEAMSAAVFPPEHEAAQLQFRRTFDSLSVDKAQTVLRYWDWLSADTLDTP